MDRVFQHYQGNVAELEGASLSAFRSIVNEDDNDVIIIWTFDENVKRWYRIFIDGTYCGVDRYEADESNSDLDDGVILDDHSAWSRGAIVVSAIVSSPTKLEGCIVLSLEFSDRNCKLICESQDGNCRLEFSGPEGRIDQLRASR